MTHESCRGRTLLAPMLMSEIPVTVGLNNKVKAGLTASRGVGARNSSASYLSCSRTQSCSTFTVNVEEMSDASHCHAMSEKLKRDREMCLDSFGVAKHSRGHGLSTDSAVRGVLCTD